jgi:hypothetical protein
MRNAYKSRVGKPEEKNMLQDAGEENRDLMQIACECADCIQLVSG